MGADDYITKPFEMRELAARIKAVSRRNDTQNEQKETADSISPQDHPNITFENWVLDTAQYQVFDKQGNSLNFTTGEFQLLQTLLHSAHRALSREQLFDHTRDGRFDSYDRAIDIQIARIRKKLGDADNTIIKTVRGIGYMYAGTISK